MRNRIDDVETLPDEREFDWQPYLVLVLQWAWLLVLAALIGGALGYSRAKRAEPVYASTTTIMIDTAPATRAADYSSLILSERLSETYTRLIQTRPIMDRVREELDLPYLGTRGISVSRLENSQLINITVMHTDPALAADVANALVRVFSREVVRMQSERYEASKTSLQAQVADMEAQIEQTAAEIRAVRSDVERDKLEQKRTLYRQIYSNLLMSLEQVRLAEAQAISTVVQVEPALYGGRIGPRARASATRSALIGLLIAAGFVFGLHFLDNTVKNPEALSRRFRLPVLGTIARHDNMPGEVIAFKHPRSPVSEAFRALRTNVRFSSPDRPLRRLMITSPTPEEGKTTVSANLGVVLAQSGERVALIDSDLRRPMIHKVLGIRNGTGLSGLFVQDAPDVEAVMAPTGVDGLRAVLSGALPPNPSELLGSNKMSEILDRMLETNDILILDTPPIMSVTDAAVLAGRADGVLVIFKPGKTKISALTQAVEQLRLVNANIIGLVANNVNLDRGGYKTYYYRRYYSKYAYYAENRRGGAKAKARRLAGKIARKTGLKKKA